MGCREQIYQPLNVGWLLVAAVSLGRHLLMESWALAISNQTSGYIAI